MITLLSPAKSLDFESKAPYTQSSELIFPDKAEYLVKKLRKFSVRKVKKMMNISEDLAQLNVDRFQSWTMPKENHNAKQAIYAFTGDVYQGMEAGTFSKSDLSYSQDHIRILSGLYGVLRPCDLILPYRLEMGTKWEITKAKNSLYKFWKSELTDRIREDLDSSDSKVVLNLASQEYAKAIDLKNLDAKVIEPEFKEERGDEFKMISFFAKKARGMMAAYVAKNRIEKIDDLKGFDTEGYTFNQRLSDTERNKWVFTRKSTTQ